MTKIFFLILGAILFFSSCSNKKSIDSWYGHYSFEEEPMEAIAGYSMAMTWDLKLSDQESFLEINGQQTFMKLEVIPKGDEEKIMIVFNKGLEGIGYEL